MDLAQYDKWVIGNQKRILDWTRKYSKERYVPIRDAFSAYHRAKSNKQKIDAFENLKKEFVSSKGVRFEDLVNDTFVPVRENLQRAADKFTKGDISALDRNSDLGNKLKVYDDLSPLSDAMSSIPEKIDNYDWVELDKAYEDNYDINALTALASKYGYDYKDKKERSEFLGKLAEIQKQKDLQKIWNDGTIWGAYTDIMTPIAKEYAQKNYENIEGVSDLAPALAADWGVNTMMAGLPGAAVTKVGGTGKVVQGLARAADNVVAPVARNTANVFLNDEDPVDAAKIGVSEIATNYATPWMLRGATRKVNKYGAGQVDKAKQNILTGTEKQVEKAQKTLAKEAINEAADKSALIQTRLKNGALFKDESGNFVKMSKDGKTIRFEGNPYGRDIISKEDMDFYFKNKGAMRGKEWGPKSQDKYGIGLIGKYDKQMSEQLSKQLKPYQVAKIKQNILNGKDPLDGLDVEDLALSVGQKPKETKFNWAARQGSEALNSNLGEAAKAYTTNLQGRTKWGGSALTSLGSLLPPQFSEKIDLNVKEKLNEKDPELDMYMRMRKLHDQYPDYFPMPKMPAKYKDFEDDLTIKSIFGR